MRLLVIGGVAAGLSAAARARRIDAGLEILVLEKGADHFLWRLRPALLHRRPRPARQPAHRLYARIISARNATSRCAPARAWFPFPIRAAKSTLDARRARALRPPGDRYRRASAQHRIRRRALPHVFTLHTLDDAERLKAYLRDQQPRQCRGRRRGIHRAGDRPMRCGATAWQSPSWSRDAHVLGRGDHRINQGRPRAAGALSRPLQLNTSSADLAAMDLVILATGLRPNVEIAAEAGVEFGRTGAIRVDDRMETNLPGSLCRGRLCRNACTWLRIVRPTSRWAPRPTRWGAWRAPMPPDGASVSPVVTGTAIVSIFGLGIAFTGLSAGQARREGFSPVSARITAAQPRGLFRRQTHSP